MCLDGILKVAQIFASMAGGIAALWALCVYRGNAQRERARWAETLYSRFFEQPNLKKIRDQLDSEANNQQVTHLVEQEGSDWTDYLNFFEFVAYLQESKQLLPVDVQALFGYYLRCLKKHPKVVEYVRDESRGSTT